MPATAKKRPSARASAAELRRRAENELRELGARRDHRPMTHALYLRAEALTKQRQQRRRPKPASQDSAADSQRLLHELQVHQVELELQNAELLEARNRMELLVEKYTDLYDFAPVGYLSLDEQGRILEANLAGAALLGVERSRLINRRLTAITAPANRAGLQAFLELVFAGPRDQSTEAQLLTDRGGTFWASLRATAAICPKGAQRWCRVSFGDITGRKQAEGAVRESEQRFRTLFDLVPVALYSCNAAGVIEKFNRRAAELWGREPAVGDTDQRFCGSFKTFRPDGSFMPHNLCPMAEVVSGKIPAVQDAEVLIERPDGSRITVIVNIRQTKNERGEATGAINCFYDITERKQAEQIQRRIEVLAASNRKLEKENTRRQVVEESLRQSERHQRDLLQQSRRMEEQLRSLSRQVLRAQEEERKRISRELHDVIAQTLTGINIRLATLKKAAGLNSKDFGRNLARTQRLVEKSVNIVHRFARDLRPAVLDDLGLIPALHAFLQGFAARTGVRAHLTAFAGLEKLDPARRTVLFRVAQEALTNVSRHARAGRVEVNIQKLTDRVCMKISDDGKSFSVADTRPANGGKRLGLLGMRERLEMVGGSFEIESARGKGTTVTAFIPYGKAGGGENSVR